MAALALAATAPGAEPLGLFQLCETRVDDRTLGIDPALDPFDAQQVAVDAELTAPDGRTIVQPMFWLVPQEAFLQPAYSSERHATVPWERFRATAPGTWCLRFAPTLSGTWRWRYRIRAGASPERTVAGAVLEAAAAHAASGGIVQDGEGNLATADGHAFIPVGSNVGWPNEDGSRMFAHYLDALSAVGANSVRVWLVHYYGGTALEWSHNDMNAGYQGVGHYSQESAARVDRLLELADAHHLKLLLSLWTFGDYSFDWDTNPYSRAGGGWLDSPGQFFTDERALAAQRNLLRYETARWGAYPSLWGWELWNEVDNCTGYDDRAVGRWHAQMASQLHALDAWHHPITTSYRFGPPQTPCSGFSAPDLTLVQSHTYWPALVAALAHDHDALAPFAKPWFAGECGLSDDPGVLAADAQGWHVHDALWGSLMSGGVGAGFCWWWDSYFEAHDLWPHLRGIARFTAQETLSGLRPGLATSDGPRTAVLARTSPTRIWAWVRDLRAIRTSGSGASVRILGYGPQDGAQATSVAISGVVDGRWHATWWDPYDGTWMGEATATAHAGSLILALPRYRDDIALKAERIADTAALPLPAAIQPPATPWHDALRRAAASPP